MEHSLSDAAIANHRNLKAKGKLISPEKNDIINKFIGSSVAHTDKRLKKSKLTGVE